MTCVLWEDVCELANDARFVFMVGAWREHTWWTIVGQVTDNEVTRKKLYSGVHNTYMSAMKFVLTDCYTDTRCLQLPKFERFVLRWVELAFRFWAKSPIQNFLTEDAVNSLFNKLVRPLGDTTNSRWSFLPGFPFAVEAPPSN